MEKHIAITLLLLLAAISACTIDDAGQSPRVCTADAKLCPDGSAVGRDPGNGCAFYDCPASQDDLDEKPIPVEPDGGIGTTDPYTRYVSSDKEECTRILYQCIEGSSAFSDETGCGCRSIEPIRYVSRDADECSRIKYFCESNFIPFSDESGCGCEFTFGEDTTPAGKLKALECTPEQRDADVCTEEYAPVCGWSGENVQCLRYPCATTYSNACNACGDENVAYYTLGECPTGDSMLR